MRQFNQWNGTKSQSRAMVQAWKKEQETKARHKLSLFFAKNASIQEAREKVMSNF